jgi:hypothetical protein
MTEFIPAIPATNDAEHDIMAGKMDFNGVEPRIFSPNEDYAQLTRALAKKSGERSPLLVIDVKGLQRHTINDVLLKEMKVRGMDVWLMTYIERVDDVFDAFNTDAEIVLAPYHAVLSDDELKDILRVSDSVIPTVFVLDGKAQCRDGTDDVVVTVTKLRKMGFSTVAVIDIDGSMTSDVWKTVSAKAEVIPYAIMGLAQSVLDECGFARAFRTGL